jgi:transcription elongation factor Elf1
MEYDKSKYKVLPGKAERLFWIINPFFLINELLLGQRIPKVMLENIASDKPKIERNFVPCPHCNTYHDSRTWSAQNKTAFMNWFGLYCPNCGKIIPCLTNATSFIILALTYPVWGWFRKSLKEKWLQFQSNRFFYLTFYNPLEGKDWIKMGLFFGFFFFLFELIINVLQNSFNIFEALFLILISILTGLSFGYFMKSYANRRVKK